LTSKQKWFLLQIQYNPTGTLLEKSSLSDFCERASDRTIVFCDEAYYDYIEEPDYPSMDYLVRAEKKCYCIQNFLKSIWNGWPKNWLFSFENQN
jgi:histidinol-phosphate aminotransferase